MCLSDIAFLIFAEIRPPDLGPTTSSTSDSIRLKVCKTCVVDPVSIIWQAEQICTALLWKSERSSGAAQTSLHCYEA